MKYTTVSGFRITLTGFLLTAICFGQLQVREELGFPDIMGYETLVCDFHMHTVFSDGNVWPHIRAEEAWREGLDAIAITDHLEYLPHRDDLTTGFNRSYEIAFPRGADLGVTVIRGAEITRGMPPGHANAIFLSDVDPLVTDRWQDAYAAAAEQEAFIFYNHPGWRGQQKDGIGRWYAEHDSLLELGWLHGIEVANEYEYYPEAHAWCLEKELTMLGNSDIHNPIHMDYQLHERDHRPVTLVFAKENTEKAIRDALFDRRTAVYAGHDLVGEERFLLPLFLQSVEFSERSMTLVDRKTAYLQVTNITEVDFHLTLEEEVENIQLPGEVVLYGGKTVLFPVKALADDLRGSETIEMNYRVDNCLVRPGEGMPVSFKIKVRFKNE